MKKLTILLSALCIPAVAWAHGTEILYIFAALFGIPTLLISLFLTYLLNRRIVINNKFLKFIVLLVIGIVLFCLFFMLLLWIGDLL